MPDSTRHATRRQLLGTGAALVLAVQWRPAAAESAPPALQALVAQWAGGRPVNQGRVQLDVAPLVENGNLVPLGISVDSPMTAADHVQEIMVYNERNPQREVARFSLSPASGVARVRTRIRLATSQRLVALVRLSDGSQWSQQADVLVTLAACIEP